MNDFQDRVVMITGASSGMGLAAVKEFLSRGATVIGVSRTVESMKEELGENFIPRACDVSNADDIISLCKYAKDRFGKLDTLFCNAGFGTATPIPKITPEEYEGVTSVMLRAPVLLTTYCYELLIKSDHACIIHTCSIASYAIGAGVLYRLTKTALNNFTRNSAAEFGGAIRVNSICPGIIRTNIVPDKGPASWEAYENTQVPILPIHRIGDAWEVAKLVAFLASDKASYVNGAQILIDGGWIPTHAKA